MNDADRTDGVGDDELLGEIFRHAQPRPRPSQAARSRAFDALQGEWQQLATRRRWRRRTFGAGLAATVLLAALFGYRGYDAGVAPPAPVHVEVLRAAGGNVYLNRQRLDAARIVAEGLVLARGDRLATDPGTRLAFAWGSSGSLRLDEQTQIALRDDDVLGLDAGSLYFDSTPYGAAAGARASLVIDTPQGRVTHAGTQFQASVDGRAVTVSVREGKVRVAGDRVDVTVEAGETLALAANGDVGRQPIPAYDPAWQWAADIAPELSAEGRTTAELFAWIARETGYRVVYGSDDARRLAGSQPRGIGTLAPMPALRTIPYMTSLEYAISGDAIVVNTNDAER